MYVCVCVLYIGWEKLNMIFIQFLINNSRVSSKRYEVFKKIQRFNRFCGASILILNVIID